MTVPVERGILAPEAYAPSFKMYFRRILKCHKILTKCFARVSQNSTCSQSHSANNWQLFSRVLKRQNSVLKKTFNEALFFLLHRPQKISVFCET